MLQADDWVSIVLAAGRGTRMKSELPKVAHRILGRPMIFWVLDLLCSLEIKRNIVVLGYKADFVREQLRGFPCQTVFQDQQLGTGDAVMRARPLLVDFDGNVLIICGDTPLFTRETMLFFMRSHAESGGNISVLTAVMKDAAGYGRIIRIRPDDDLICGIVEEKDASDIEKGINEVNVGVYAVNSILLFNLLDMVVPENAQHEYYLTDIVKLAVSQGEKVNAVCCASDDEAQGVNSRDDLMRAEAIMSARGLSSAL
ncbi:MAG: NTP transferase domain-containing protein [Desulfobacteraceae bacterium]|nr:NTP transferase domain-containing protein [Desulfobacteraceae bacterium]